ncbi:hypothetical protein BALAC2494_01732 [Bifidobacterium animalis subsp. lactis CNCM I-2494]|uniref:Uncharacterized protein n=1 Tax=Bifidobacterium animalis subsp. lactis CNCM I-2494 TaxID=1042403 RepID=A0A806FSG4_BIFAN|nr:hypothetical protein BALAC2494_01732 [Bifidobacterium animalis subsp. lactis CNCM I-2494]
MQSGFDRAHFQWSWEETANGVLSKKNFETLVWLTRLAHTLHDFYVQNRVRGVCHVAHLLSFVFVGDSI